MECSWHRRPQPPELNTNSPSRWPWAGSSQFHPPGRLQWPGPASARPEGTRCRGDYSPFPVRHLSSAHAHKSFAPGAQDTASSHPVCSLLPPTLDEPLPTAPPPPDGEGQCRQPALRPWWLQEKGRQGGRNGESGEHWRLGVWMQSRGKGAQASEVREVPGLNPQLSVFLLRISLQIPLSSGEDSPRDLTTWADSETPKST